MARKSWLPCALVAVSGALGCATAGRTTAPATPQEAAFGGEMVFVEGGCFRMGSASGPGGPEERPAHEVCVDDFYIGKYEVTQGQWKAIMGSNPSSHDECGEDCPVEMVSWNDVQRFIGKLNDGRTAEGDPGAYRRPTEAEWEYAARSRGRNEKYSGKSDDLGSVAWYLFNSEAEDPNSSAPHPVGGKDPNGLGIHDMSGNVWEWTSDWYGATYYSSSPRDNPRGPSSGDRRVLRGGGYGEDAFDLRTTYRNYLPPDHRGGGKGFRLVRTAPAKAR